MTSKSFFIFFLKAIVLPALILGAAAGVFMYMKNTKPAVPAEPMAEKSWGVATYEVQLIDAAPEVVLYGAIEAGETVQLSATVNAFVDKVRADKGDHVKQGQSLVVLDERELRLTMDQRQASMQDVAARIQQEIERVNTDRKAYQIEQQLQAFNLTNLARQEELVANNMAPASRLEDATKAVHQQQLSLLNRQSNINNHPHRLAQLEAAAAQSKSQLAFARLDLERTTITAPFDGRILSVDTAAGNRVRNGDRVIRMYNTDSLEVRSQVPARYLNYLQPNKTNQSLSAHMQHNGKSVVLTLDRLSAEATGSRGGTDAFFTLPANQDVEIGRNVQIVMQLPKVQQVVAIPSLALYGQNRVYRIVDSRLQAIAVDRIGDITDADGQSLTLVRSADLQDHDLLLITQLPNAVSGLLVEAR
ncbi:MAG TPA: secretion protein HlyD [Oceanospirillaceae bacterium]|nr:secretion protein HlyD [Oceanospirillaceae bacterium]